MHIAHGFLLLGGQLAFFQSSRRSQLTLIRGFWIHGSVGYIFIVNLVMVFLKQFKLSLNWR
jgi:hypothetical protein